MRLEQIETEIADLIRIQVIAEGANKTGDAVKAVEKIGKLRAEAIRLKRGAEIDSITDEVERLRAQARLATEEGSWIAAERFSSAANLLFMERERIALEKQQLEFSNMTTEELLDSMLELIPELSLDMLLKLNMKVSECIHH